MRPLVFFFLFLLVVSCGTSSSPKGYIIGRDPTWYPLSLGQETPAINAFTQDLLAAISQRAALPLQLQDVSWDALYQGLEEGHYSAIVTGLTPDVKNKHLYSFSTPFLLLGPVLILPKNSSFTSLADLQNGVVGINEFDSSVLLVQQYPDLFIRFYQNMPTALDDLVEGRLDAVLLNVLDAQALIPTRYAQTLEIASPPLTDAGLRLVTLYHSQPRLMARFNAALEDFLASPAYTELRKNFLSERQKGFPLIAMPAFFVGENQ